MVGDGVITLGLVIDLLGRRFVSILRVDTIAIGLWTVVVWSCCKVSVDRVVTALVGSSLVVRSMLCGLSLTSRYASWR